MPLTNFKINFTLTWFEDRVRASNTAANQKAKSAVPLQPVNKQNLW